MTKSDNQEKEIPISWDRLLWCNVHGHRIEKVTQRNGVIHYHCGPRRGGITMPCICTELTGLVEITEERVGLRVFHAPVSLRLKDNCLVAVKPGTADEVVVIKQLTPDEAKTWK